MKFTVILESDETTDRTYGLVFVPYPIWVMGHREVLSLNPQSNKLEVGSLQKLIEQENIRKIEKCVVVLHDNIGRGMISDLDILIEDMKSMYLNYKIVSF